MRKENNEKCVLSDDQKVDVYNLSPIGMNMN